MSNNTNAAVIEIFRKQIKSKSNLISNLLHEIGHFLLSFKANHNDEWHTTCYLAAILHETHKQHLGRILPNLDSLSVAESAVTY